MNRTLVYWIIALAAPLALGAALAQAGNLGAECHAIEDGDDRLACYDRVSGRSAPPRPEASLLGERWNLDAGAEQGDRFRVKYHRANYLLLARKSDHVNDHPASPSRPAAGVPGLQLEDTEAKFQVSFKARLWETEDRRWAVWAGYTQQNQWQLYNGPQSRPFRETNYQPELMLAYRPDIPLGDFRWRVLNLSLNHQSNGRADPLSRSWNRVYAEFGVERGSFALLVRPWYRIPESAEKDDNPDITDYLGHGDLTALYKRGGHTFELMGRGNVSTGKGAAQLSWSTPPLLGPLRFYVQVFSGYGESLIDYNWRQTTVGAGVALGDGL